MSRVKVLGRIDGKQNQSLQLDGFEDYVRSFEGDLKCDVCGKLVKKGNWYLGLFYSGHQRCVDRADKKELKEITEEEDEL